MPRNSSGTYTLPNAPVVTSTTIDSADENDTRDDLASEMTNSLDRGGRGAMTAALKIVDGSAASPGIQFSSDANNGWYRNSADNWSGSAGSVEVVNFSTNGMTMFSYRLTPLSPAQITSNQNDYAPASFSTASMLRLDTDAARELTGLAGGTTGRVIDVHYIGATTLTLKDESASSAAANRFALPADLVLGPDMSVRLVYDGTSSRWRMNTGAVSSVMVPVTMASSLGAAASALAVISNSLIDAKGDLIVGTAADTPARKAVGSNGQILVADSTQSDGLIWTELRHRHLLINGSGEVNQRATTSAQADDTYGHDRWYRLTQSNAIAVSDVADAENTTPRMMRLTQSNASAQRMGYAQIIEGKNCKHLRGQTVTFRFGRKRLSSSANVRIAVLEWTGTEDSVTSDVVNDWTSSTYTAGNFFLGSNLTVSAVAQQALTANTLTDGSSLTVTLGSSFNNLIVFVWTESTVAQNVTLDLAKAQLELGSVATPYEHEDAESMLVKCQRCFSVFWVELFFYANIVGERMGVGVTLPVQMRTSPTVTADAATVATNVSTTSLSAMSEAYVRVYADATSAGANVEWRTRAIANAEL